MVNTPIPHSLKSEAKKAAKILKEFTVPTAKAGPDKLIPSGILLKAKGLAILTVVKAGFLVTARAGSGIVIAKLSEGLLEAEWSAPSAIGIAGLGGGFEIGAEVTDFVILLMSKSSVEAFSKGGNLTLGGNFSIAAGPLGRNIEADVAVRSPAAIYTYSKTKGLFAGISVEGSALIERKDANKKFYGQEIRAHQILSGDVSPPIECMPLYKVLERHREIAQQEMLDIAKRKAHKQANSIGETIQDKFSTVAMPRRRNWKKSIAKSGDANPMSKKKRTDLTGDPGPDDTTCSVTNNRSNDSDCHDQVAGDPVLLNNRSNDSSNDCSNDSSNDCSRYCSNDCSNDCSRDCSNDCSRDCLENCSQDYIHGCSNDCTIDSISDNTLLDNSCFENTLLNSCFEDNSYFESTLLDNPCFENPNKDIQNQVTVNEVNIFDNIYLKFGSFDQSDSQFSSLTRGNQCTCNCLVYLAFVSAKMQDQRVDLDSILNIGDYIYLRTVEKLRNEGRFRNMLLSFDEIPNIVEIRGNKLQIQKKDVLFGSAVQSDSTDDFLTLQEALAYGFQHTKTLLVMIGSICSGVYYDGNIYYFFDSHSHGQSGLYEPYETKGTSILIGFENIQSLIYYMYSYYTSMHIDLQSQFEILPVDFINMDATLVLQRQIQEYFEDQNRRNLVEHSDNKQGEPETINNRKEYMKKYMQNRRKSSIFREKERQKDVNAKRIAREDDDVRQYELDKKRKAREDDDVRQKELDKKRKAREDDDVRQQEAEDKRLRREDLIYRSCERARDKKARQKVREDDDVRQKDLDKRRKAREDDDVRQKELDKKRKAREDDDVRQQEAEDKRLRREDLIYRSNERVRDREARQKAREDDGVRQNELENKRKAREDDDVRQKELDKKRKAREDDDVRQNELDKKRKAREDDDVRQQEAEHKRLRREDLVYRSNERVRDREARQKAREDDGVRQNELENKRKAREDDDVRQKELDKKRKAREDDDVRQKELDKKRKAREDDDVRQLELENKRKVRENDQVKEKERISKQSSRNRNRLKNKTYETLFKSQKRQNKDFVCRENKLKKQRQTGSSLQHCIDIFHQKMLHGPTYICTSCHQTWFSDSVTNASRIKQTAKDDMKQCFTNRKSVNDMEWICNTCIESIRQNKVPRLSIANKMGFPAKPIELNLYPLEERLLSLRIPFMQIRMLPRGGQLSVKGNVVNVPVDVQPTINSLPHTFESSGTIAVKLKKKLSYNKCDFSENVRPFTVLRALHYLMQTSNMYKESGVQIDQNWLQEITAAQNNDESDDVNNSINENEHADQNDGFDEINEDNLHAGNTDTLLDEVLDESSAGGSQYVFAPGEGQRPLSLYSDTDAEYLAFPTLFCGQRRPDNKERLVPVHYTDIVKWELRSVDRRVAQSVPNLFFKLKKIQMKHISDRVNLALRRCKSEGKKWTVRDFLNPSTVNDIVKLDEGYYIFRSLRNSPVYLEKRKKDVFAMIRQLGLPTWFGSFSSADTNWKDLLRILGQLNDGKSYSDEELDQMDWNTKSKLVQKDPVTCSRFFDYRVKQFINTVLMSDHDPIGRVIDYFYRVEFQQRGSPHIHMLVWIENAPIYEQNSNEDIVQFIDKYISCSLSSAPSDLVSLQVHKHSKTCRSKGQPICRFGFPLPPLDKTVILEPLVEDVEKYKAIYKEVQIKIDSLHTMENIDNMSFEQFLDLLQLSREDYLKAIRSNLSCAKVFLKRKPNEVRVNPYMKALLPAWKANHDLQFVLDPYACAVYIVSYISKSQKGMSGLLDQAAKEAREGNFDLKRQVRHIGNYFTNAVETCAQEAVYLTLQIPLTKATRQVVFINTSPPDQRTFLLKSASQLEKLSPDSTDIESNNDIKRYAKRPSQLQNWCLADYISQLEVKYPTSDEEQNKSQSENEYETDEELEITEENDKKINITLKNGIVIRQRKSPRVIRYVRYNRKTDSENYFRERLLLFYPWRNEQVDLKAGKETYESMYNSVHRIVENKARQYEHNAEKLDKAIADAESDCHQYDELAPGTQQVELEDAEEGSKEADQYVHFNPDRPTEHRHYDLSEEVGVAARTVEVMNHANRMDDVDYYELVRSLNQQQREFFLHVLTWIKSKSDPLHLFLTGGAGVGKSVVVKALFQALHRYLCSKEGEDPDDIRILLCAPTGKAAYNINGLTIHNAFQIQPNKGLDQSLSCDVLNTLRMKYRNLSMVMIDEISMVGNKMFSLLDTRLRKIKGNNQVFGGVSVIAIGDFFQLKPVFDGWIFQDLSKGISALAPNLWKDLFKMHELTQIMRQKDDLEFAELLNRLRQNNLNDNDFAILNTRVVTADDASYQKNSTHLFVENNLVDQYNKRFITSLTSEKVTVKAVDSVVGDLSQAVKAKLISSLPQKQSDTANLAQEVELAVGMKYDLTANIDVTDGLTNGSSCEVKSFEYKTKTPRPSIVWVQFDDEKVGIKTRKKYSHLFHQNIDKTWTPVFDIKRSFGYRLKNFERIQMPLRPSAGKTIHKSQGDTLKQVVVSLDSKCKGKIPHIHYVALSRVTSLSGLQILSLNQEKISVSDNVKDEIDRLKSEAVLSLCFTPLYNLPSEKFKVIFNNARSFHAHYKDVRADPSILDADVIGIAESRLIHSDNTKDYLIAGFQPPIRLDQHQTNAGSRPPHGLVVYIKNDCVLQRELSYSTPTLEFLLVEIISPSKGLFQVVVVYRGPECSLQNLKDGFLSNLFPILDFQNKNLFIIGDFNFDLLSGQTNFLNFMSETFMCSQIVTKPTRLYKTLLDHIFVNKSADFRFHTDVLDAYWSDHQIVYIAADSM